MGQAPPLTPPGGGYWQVLFTQVWPALHSQSTVQLAGGGTEPRQ
jgi:hypothetical protein